MTFQQSEAEVSLLNLNSLLLHLRHLNLVCFVGYTRTIEAFKRIVVLWQNKRFSTEFLSSVN